MEFIKTVVISNVINLELFDKYKNDRTLKNIDMLYVARVMLEPFAPVRSNSDGFDFTFNIVITEFGVCYSSTHLYKYQNPYGYGYGIHML